VTLPGVGCFVAELMPSTFSDKGYTINPPYRRLSFLPRQGNDTYLANLYARDNEGVDPVVATRILTEFLAEMKEILKVRKTIVFPGLGRLRATRENHFFFVADEDLDIYPEGLGLGPISLKTHAESPEEVASAVASLAGLMTEPVSEIPSEPQPVSEPKPAVEPEPEHQPAPEPEQVAAPEPFFPEPEPFYVPDPVPAEPEREPAPEPVELEPRPVSAEPEQEPEPESGHEPGEVVKPEAEPVTEPEPVPDAKPDAKPDDELPSGPASQPKEEPESGSQPKPQTEPLPLKKPEPQPKPEPKPEPESEPVSQPAAKVAPQSDRVDYSRMIVEIVFVVVAVFLVLLLIYVLVGRFAPSVLDPLLYSPEELEILRY
jgi:hypothetical protein